MTLGEFLQSRLSDDAPWNCSTDQADWCVSLGYPDFAAAWRDITEPGECDRIPDEAGGLVVLWDRGIGDALRVVTDVDQGDIAVIRAHGHEVGAIFTGERWAVRGDRKMHFLAPGQVRVIKAWRP